LQDNALRQGSGRSSAPSTQTDNQMTSGLQRCNRKLEIPLTPEFHAYYSKIFSITRPLKKTRQNQFTLTTSKFTFTS
jgi:hypothetical protein